MIIRLIRIIIRLIIKIIVFCLFGWILCDIAPETEYTWYFGIWHGLYFVPNLVRSLFADALYMAEIYTTAYIVFYWVSSIVSIIGLFIEDLIIQEEKTGDV